MSAERNTSNGAPFWICVKKFPDEPKVSRTCCPVSFSNRDTISGRADCRSEAAATVRLCADATRHTSSRQTTVRTRGSGFKTRPFMKITRLKEPNQVDYRRFEYCLHSRQSFAHDRASVPARCRV